ncbi:MAG: thioredoxin family protein [Hyphomicrobium sp.]
MGSRCVKFIVFVIFIGLSLLTEAVADPPPQASAWNGKEISWNDLRTGVPEATQSGKTVMMVFYTSWCTSCRKYRSLFSDKRVVEAAQKLVMILIDADEDKMANGAYSPDGTYVPRTIFLTPDGDVRDDLVGKTDQEHPHSIDITNPDELLSLMLKAGTEDRDRGTFSSDQRASN